MPEAVMVEHRQLVVLDELLHGLRFQHQILTVIQVVEDAPAANEETAGNAAGGSLRLLVETDDPLRVDLQLPEATGGTHAGHGHDLAVPLVELDQGADVDI